MKGQLFPLGLPKALPVLPAGLQMQTAFAMMEVKKSRFKRKDVLMKGNGSKTLGIIILIIFIIASLKMCSEPSPSEKFYQEHKAAIDDYNERHKDDWKGYKGTRRSSWAEDEKLKQDGIDPEEYRAKNGY